MFWRDLTWAATGIFFVILGYLGAAALTAYTRSNRNR